MWSEGRVEVDKVGELRNTGEEGVRGGEEGDKEVLGEAEDNEWVDLEPGDTS